MRIRSLTALAAAMLLIAGCGERDETETTPPTEAPAAEATPAGDAQISKDLTVKPTIPQPTGEPPTSLVKEDIVEGTGRAAKAGDQVTVQYVGVAHSTGTEFDASWNRGEPFRFQLGTGQVIPGWDRGVAGMKEGGRRKLVIPPDLGYGAQGAGPDIGPNETLIFVVDLEKIG